MKQKIIILGVFAIVCLMSSGYYAWNLQHKHSIRVAEWNEGAKAAFKEVLRMEVVKRLREAKSVSIRPYKEEKRDSIHIITPESSKIYHIKSTKYENSLIKKYNEKMLLTNLFSNYPLSIDTLTLRWDSCLSARQIIGNSRIRYIYTDEDLNNDTVYTQVANHTSLDSLTVIYMGIRCEHELMPFISYPHWLSELSWSVWTILSLPWLLFALLIWQYSRLENWVQHKLEHEKIKVVVQERIVEVEKEVYVSNVPMDKVDVFKLPDGTLFDPSAKCLFKGGIQHRIQPQSVSLLKLFLTKSDYKITIAEISRTLWQEEREKQKLYMAIKRLRNDLKAVNSNLTIVYIGEAYELK